MKSFAVIGLSTFGYYMAQFLAEREMEVVVVDSDEKRVEQIKGVVTKGIIADAVDREVLKSLGLADMDAAIVSLGEDIDASLLVALYLKELGLKEIFVKVMTEDHATILTMMGDFEIIFPERDSAYRLAQRIDNPDILDYVPLTEGYSIIDLAPPGDFIGKNLGELDLRNKHGIQVVIIKEKFPKEKIHVPRADYVIKESDVLVVMGKNEDLEEIRKLNSE